MTEVKIEEQQTEEWISWKITANPLDADVVLRALMEVASSYSERHGIDFLSTLKYLVQESELATLPN